MRCHGMISNYIFVSLIILHVAFTVAASQLYLAWDIQNPRIVSCNSVEGRALCENAVSDIRVEITVAEVAKYPFYRIFKAPDCEEEFDNGRQPVVGTATNVRKLGNSTMMKKSSEKADDGNTTAYVEFSLADVPVSWVEWFGDISRKMAGSLVGDSVHDYDDGMSSVEFCIRVSLWTSRKSDAIEVNFRELNSEIIFNHANKTVSNVHIEQKEMPQLKVELNGFGAQSKTPAKRYDKLQEEL